MRPVWHDAEGGPEAIAELLEQASAAGPDEAFTARPAPHGRSVADLHQAALLVARKRLTERHGEKDRVLMQEVAAIDDLARASNLLSERLREWYGLHAPEAVRHTDDAAALARLVAEHGDRGRLMAAIDRADEAERSLGSELAAEDMVVLQGFAGGLEALYGSWRAIERRIDSLMEEVAPNVASVVGPNLGARLIQGAGGLQRLAGLSSGTIQTLGAEDALFRHLKEGTKPPKHGLLYQHPTVFQAPPWHRGAIARAFSLHISLAAKADAFTGNDLRAHLRKALDEDLVRISKKPKPQPQRTGRGHAGGPRGGAKGRGKGAAKGATKRPAKGGGRGPPRGQGQGKGRGPPGQGAARPPGRGGPRRGKDDRKKGGGAA